jgi:hypothetical protein
VGTAEKRRGYGTSYGGQRGITGKTVIQCTGRIKRGCLHIVGETHTETVTPDVEERIWREKGVEGGVYGEHELAHSEGEVTVYGDPPRLRYAHALARIEEVYPAFATFKEWKTQPGSETLGGEDIIKSIITELREMEEEIKTAEQTADPITGIKVEDFQGITNEIGQCTKQKAKPGTSAGKRISKYIRNLRLEGQTRGTKEISELRSEAMYDYAKAHSGSNCVWKVGKDHLDYIKNRKEEESDAFVILTDAEYKEEFPDVQFDYNKQEETLEEKEEVMEGETQEHTGGTPRPQEQAGHGKGGQGGPPSKRRRKIKRSGKPPGEPSV